jgi:hypothetical protein
MNDVMRPHFGKDVVHKVNFLFREGLVLRRQGRLWRYYWTRHPEGQHSKTFDMQPGADFIRDGREDLTAILERPCEGAYIRRVVSARSPVKQ